MSTLSLPQQQRSRDTMNAIADATKRLLKTHTFRDLTIDQIVKEAGASSGSFYARFKGKSALLHYLQEETNRISLEGSSQFAATMMPNSITAEEFAAMWVPAAIQFHGAHLGVFRAVLLESFDDPSIEERVTNHYDAIASIFAEIIKDPTGNPKAHRKNVGLAMETVLALLDRDLFTRASKRQFKTNKAKINHLVQVFVASMTAPQQHN